MRKELEVHEGDRRTFTGTFVRFGEKTGWQGEKETTILLANIMDCQTRRIVSDHLWFTYTKTFRKAIDPPELFARPKEGTRVQFDARVTRYVKGYFGNREGSDEWGKPPEDDQKLSRPTKIKIVEPEADLNVLVAEYQERELGRKKKEKESKREEDEKQRRLQIAAERRREREK